MKVALTIILLVNGALLVEGILLAHAYSDFLWGWRGLFFYHKEELQGHMFCHIGWRYYVRVFGKKFSWDTGRAE